MRSKTYIYKGQNLFRIVYHGRVQFRQSMSTGYRRRFAHRRSSPMVDLVTVYFISHKNNLV